MRPIAGTSSDLPITSFTTIGEIRTRDLSVRRASQTRSTCPIPTVADKNRVDPLIKPARSLDPVGWILRVAVLFHL